MRYVWSVCFLVLIDAYVTDVSSAAQAQTGQNAAPGLSEQYEDWTVECAEAGGASICTMVQDVRLQGQSERLIAARIDLATRNSPRMTLILPLGLDLDAGIGIYPGTSQDALTSVSPSVCHQNECYAFVPLTSEYLKALEEPIALRMRLTPFNAQAREVPLSLRGFASALERLYSLAE